MVSNCSLNGVKRTAGIQLSNLDTTTPAGENFYQYACGGWMKQHPLTAEYSRFGSFDKLAEDNKLQIKSLIEELAAQQNEPGSVADKIATLYQVAMDSVKLNADGVKPLRPFLEAFAGINDKAQLVAQLPYMMLKGCPVFYTMYVTADPMNSTQNILFLSQGGLSIGDRDYYLDNDPTTVGIREAFVKQATRMFMLCGFDQAQADRATAAVMRIETALAQGHMDKVTMRDPYATYNKMTLSQLNALSPAIDWGKNVAALGLTQIDQLNVEQPKALEAVSNVITAEPLDALIAYCQWHAIAASAAYLSDDLSEAHFDFFGKVLSGAQEQSPRWKRAQAGVSSSLGEALGQMYVKKYFPAEAKQRMTDLVHNLQQAYAQRIQNLDWMSDSTKTKAIEKLNAFYVKIGYPDTWKDYTSLDIKNDSYLSNMLRINEFLVLDNLKDAGKPVDKDKWYMTPQTVNAYYNPSTNEICFPAGILQYPFFDIDADDAFNYGAIGVVIGHEMTHGFDDQGRQFDKEGNLQNWWTDNDAKQFNERAKVMSDFYDRIEVAPGVHANGPFTLGETLADFGGLQIAYQAYRNATKDAPLADKEGFSPDQRFFLAYANVWAGNIREQEILRRTKSDPHALGKWRVNGELPHIQAWYDAFGITASDPMYLPVEQRVTIW